MELETEKKTLQTHQGMPALLFYDLLSKVLLSLGIKLSHLKCSFSSVHTWAANWIKCLRDDLKGRPGDRLGKQLADQAYSICIRPERHILHPTQLHIAILQLLSTIQISCLSNEQLLTTNIHALTWLIKGTLTRHTLPLLFAFHSSTSLDPSSSSEAFSNTNSNSPRYLN